MASAWAEAIRDQKWLGLDPGRCFSEDQSRGRKDHAPEYLAVTSYMALNLLKQDTTAKSGIKAKRLEGAWSEDYPLNVLARAKM